MNAITRLSAKGQVVIPKASRDRLALEPGCELDVIDTEDGMLLRVRRTRETISFDEARERLAAILHYDGPPVSIEEMNETIADAWSKSGSHGVW